MTPWSGTPLGICVGGNTYAVVVCFNVISCICRSFDTLAVGDAAIV